MFKHFKSCLAPALLGAALCAPAAHAVDFSLVSSGNTANYTQLLSVGLLATQKDYSFQLDLLGATVATSTLDLNSLLSVSTGGTLEIWNATSAGVATSFTGFSANLPLLNVASPWASFAPLVDGYYVARLKDSILVSTSLSTTFTATAAVPEAETYAMLALGLPLVVLAARRRRQA